MTPVQTWTRLWGSDPWTQGYVTTWRPGDVEAVGPLHGTHEPPFYVCGSDQWVAGYMEGAVRTGRGAGAGHDPQQRIAGSSHQTIVSRHRTQTLDEDHAPRRQAQAAAKTGDKIECLARHLAEGESDQRATRMNPGIWRGRCRRGLYLTAQRIWQPRTTSDMRRHAPSPVSRAAGHDEPFRERQCGIDCFGLGNGASSLRTICADNESTIGAAFDPDIGRRLRERAARAAVDGEAEFLGQPEPSIR
jgi:hypothetical protein